MKGLTFTFLLFILFSIPSHAQLVSATVDGSWVYIPQDPGAYKKPFLLKAGLENWFTKRIALGVNAQLGMASFEDVDCAIGGSKIIWKKDLEVSNAVYSINLYGKYAIFHGDDYSISLKPELGVCRMESMPTISTTDYATGSVDVRRYSSVSRNTLCFGFGIQGQYFITEQWDICLSLGYNSYDFGKSLNRIDLNNEWSRAINEKTSFLSAGMGFHYYLVGKDKR